MGHKDENTWVFSSLFCLLFQFHNRKSMLAVLHSDINSLKFSLLHLTGQPYCIKSRSAKFKDGIINLILRKDLIDHYAYSTFRLNFDWKTKFISLEKIGCVFRKFSLKSYYKSSLISKIHIAYELFSKLLWENILDI